MGRCCSVKDRHSVSALQSGMEKGKDLQEDAQPVPGGDGKGAWVKFHYNGDEDMRALLYFVVGGKGFSMGGVFSVCMSTSIFAATHSLPCSTQRSMLFPAPQSMADFPSPSKRLPTLSGVSFPARGERRFLRLLSSTTQSSLFLSFFFFFFFFWFFFF